MKSQPPLPLLGPFRLKGNQARMSPPTNQSWDGAHKGEAINVAQSPPRRSTPLEVSAHSSGKESEAQEGSPASIDTNSSPGEFSCQREQRESDVPFQL